MKSSYKKAIVYDLETGGLKKEYCSVTEIAAVAVDLETLEIIDETEMIIKPYLDLRVVPENALKAAKVLYKEVSEKEPESGKNLLAFKGELLSINNLNDVVDDVVLFWERVKKLKIKFLEGGQLEEFLTSSDLGDITNLYFELAYNSGAFAVNKMNKQMLEETGVCRLEAIKKFGAFMMEHKVGNNKPLLSGHNIKRFDNPILEKFLLMSKVKLESLVNDCETLDTLELVKLRFTDISGYSLSETANALGIVLKDAHRALPDTIANAKLLISLLKSLRGEGAQSETYERRKYSMNY